MRARQVRTLESAYALELAKRRTAALRRAVDTYTTASLFVSARGDARWALMHMNDSALRLAGLPALDPKTDFWDVFRCAGLGHPCRHEYVARS